MNARVLFLAAVAGALLAWPALASRDEEGAPEEEFETVRRLELRVRAALGARGAAPGETMSMVPATRHVLRGTVDGGGAPLAECVSEHGAGEAGVRE
jgi:hypothetical protein